MKARWLLVVMFAMLGFVLPGGTASGFSLAPAGAGLEGENKVFYSGKRYVFEYREAGVLHVRYEIKKKAVRRGVLEIYETVHGFYPMAHGGTRYRNVDGSLLAPSQFADRVKKISFRHSLYSDGVRFEYTEKMKKGLVTQKRYDITMRGKTLIIHAYAVLPRDSAFGNYAGFVFDRSERAVNAREVPIPYLEMAPVTAVTAEGAAPFFYSTYIDPWWSNANGEIIKSGFAAFSSDSVWNSTETLYVPTVGGGVPPFDETAYITVSGDVRDVMARPEGAPSPYRVDLNDRVVLDMWGVESSPFALGKQTVVTLKQVFGMDRLAVIYHFWQTGGYDCSLPLHVPARAEWGGDAGLRDLVDTAKGFDYLFALHENYYDMYPGPLWDLSDLALDADGSWSEAWYNKWCATPQAYQIAPDRMKKYAAAQSPEIKRLYGTNAAYLDVTTVSKPNIFVDYFRAPDRKGGTFKEVLELLVDLDLHQQSTYQGPLFGEGRFECSSLVLLQAGPVDGVEGEICNKDSAPVIPDFVLRYLKPLRVDQGMGYHGRWVGERDAPQRDDLDIRSFDWDKYRATAIAFGRAGFMGTVNFVNSSEDFYRYWVREYYTFRALQERYLSSSVRDILYRAPDGAFTDLAGAVRAGVDFYNAQLLLTYENGLTVYVNRHQSEIWAVNVGGMTYYLPPNGWLAYAPDGFLQASHLVDASGAPNPNGHRVDYVFSSHYIFADGRGETTQFGVDYAGQPVVTAGIRVVKPDGWTLDF